MLRIRPGNQTREVRRRSDAALCGLLLGRQSPTWRGSGANVLGRERNVITRNAARVKGGSVHRSLSSNEGTRRHTARPFPGVRLAFSTDAGAAGRHPGVFIGPSFSLARRLLTLTTSSTKTWRGRFRRTLPPTMDQQPPHLWARASRMSFSRLRESSCSMIAPAAPTEPGTIPPTNWQKPAKLFLPYGNPAGKAGHPQLTCPRGASRSSSRASRGGPAGRGCRPRR